MTSQTMLDGTNDGGWRGWQVVSEVNWPGRDRVGVIAMPSPGRGWLELTPDEADTLAAALMEAAAATRLAQVVAS